MTLHKKIITLTSVLLLFGCNQEQGNQSTSVVQHATITTQDIVSYSPENTVATLDLTQAVSTDSDEKAHLASIESLSDYNQCTIVEQKRLIAHIATDTSQVCRFTYLAKGDDSHSQSTGVAQIVVSDSQLNSAPLRPLNRAAQHSSTLQINLKDILPTSTHVSKDSIELYGETSTGEKGSVSLQGDVLHYTAPKNSSGAVRLFYTAEDAQLTQVHPGVIYITISETNTPPIAQTNTELPDKVLADTPSKRFTIDIRDYISDDDDNDLQLVEVYTNGLGTREILPWSTQFDYAPTQSGDHYISYVITDHYGGYAVGSLHFTVMHYASIYDEQQEMTFSATYTLEELTRMGGAHSGVFMEIGTTGEPGYYPTFDRQLAQAYCTRKGQTLPSVDQIRQLFQNQLKSQPIYTTSYRWPSGMPYVGSDGTVSLNDGNYDSAVSNSVVEGYLTCVNAKAGPTEYSFDHKYYGTDWDETVMVSASQSLSNYDFQPLPVEEYLLEYQVTETIPDNLHELVEVKIVNNQVTVARSSTMVRQATLEVRSPNVSGNTDKTTLLIGLSECPSDVTVDETQILGCIPVIDGSYLAFTAALPDQILSQLGFNLFNNTPSALLKSNTNPNYSYFDPQILGDYVHNHPKLDPFITPLCEMLNASLVAGRDNWRWAWYDSAYFKLPESTSLTSPLASEITRWMSDNTGYSLAATGQGFYAVSDKNVLYQDNQANAWDFIVTQGAYTASSYIKEWQYITCVSGP